MFDEDCISGSDEFRSNVRVLGELCQHGIVHDAFFHRFPVFAQRFLAVPARAGGEHGGGEPTDVLLDCCVVELHGLEIVFRGWPRGAVKFEAVGSEVGHVAVVVVGAVETDFVGVGVHIPKGSKYDVRLLGAY